MHCEKGGKNNHVHEMDLDGNGTGDTTSTSAGVTHGHKIVNWEISPAMLGDQEHTHKIDEEKKMGIRKEGDKDDMMNKTYKHDDPNQKHPDPDFIEDKEEKSFAERMKENAEKVKIEVKVTIKED